MELRAQREKRKQDGKERWMMCLPYHPKLPGWWKCIAVPWCCRGRRVCHRRSPPKPLATSSSSLTPPCSILCWREVRGRRLKWAFITFTSHTRPSKAVAAKSCFIVYESNFVKRSLCYFFFQKWVSLALKARVCWRLYVLSSITEFVFSDGLFSWSRAVQIRTNLDLVLDWLQGAGLGDIASEFMKKLSITVNFLCIPKTRLIQVTQLHVQCDFSAPGQEH